MGIMDNEGHDPMGFGNVRSALPMQADPDPRAALKEARAEIGRLRAIIATVSKHWSEGHDGSFSANWDQDDAASGFWLPAENADAIRAAITGAHEQAQDRKP